jgi:membrane associated rhomboid family serine protease
MKLFSSFSNILILLSAIATGIAFFVPESYMFGINRYFFDLHMYYMFILQCFTGMFLHGGLLHLLSNGLFIYIF